MENFCLTNPVVSLYDGDAGDSTPDPNALAQAAATAAAKLQHPSTPDKTDPNAPVGGDPNARFNQEQVNKIIQDRVAKVHKSNDAKFKTLEGSYQELLANQSLNAEEREKLEEQLEDLRKQHRTKEEQAKHEKRQIHDEYEVKLETAEKQAKYWENEYRTSTVSRSLIDAAVKNDAFVPEQVVVILREHTKLVEPVDENGKTVAGAALVPMVDLPDLDAETGKSIITQSTPDIAIARLRELHPYLFKGNVVSGVGGNSSTGGVTPGADGKLDAASMSTEQYMEQRKKDRTQLGLRSRRGL